jgi:cytochrome c oxidase subunit II
VPTVSMIFKLDKTPTGKVIEVDAIGHQWWWEFRYPQLGVTTANEMVIPEDTQVALRLCAAGDTNSGTPVGQPCDDPAPAVGDAVIHSFWVPRLAGKQDVIPGQTNQMNLMASEPGTYPGQCAEYCGLSHAYMRFVVEAKTEADFQAWLANQKAPAATTPPASFTQCIGCHTVAPDATGIGGPDLTHLQSRPCFAGCWLDMSPENLAAWLKDPQAQKPGAFMPNLKLTDDQIKELVAYLETLE